MWGEFMADAIGKGKKSKTLNTILEQSIIDAQCSRRSKRIAQHQHWMRVMMEGQATPDLRYQRPKV